MWCDCGHGSSAVDPLYGLACPFLGTDEVVTLGSILVYSTHSEVPTRKGQYSCQRSNSESTPNCLGYRRGYRRGEGFAIDGGSLDVEEGILGRSQAQDSVVQASSRPTIWWIVLESSRIIGSQEG